MHRDTALFIREETAKRIATGLAFLLPKRRIWVAPVYRRGELKGYSVKIEGYTLTNATVEQFSLA